MITDEKKDMTFDEFFDYFKSFTPAEQAILEDRIKASLASKRPS